MHYCNGTVEIRSDQIKQVLEQEHMNFAHTSYSINAGMCDFNHQRHQCENCSFIGNNGTFCNHFLSVSVMFELFAMCFRIK